MEDDLKYFCKWKTTLNNFVNGKQTKVLKQGRRSQIFKLGKQPQIVYI